MADEVGITGISACGRGLAGEQTPNIDASPMRECYLLTTTQSSTEGRSAFITGQHPVRTGLTKVGFPGSPICIQEKDPTLAELLKNHSYVTGQGCRKRA